MCERVSSGCAMTSKAEINVQGPQATSMILAFEAISATYPELHILSDIRVVCRTKHEKSITGGCRMGTQTKPMSRQQQSNYCNARTFLFSHSKNSQ